MTLIPLPEPKPRPRDEIWDTVCEVWHLNADTFTKADRSRVNGIVRDFKIKRATPELIKRAYKRARQIWPKLPIESITERAVLNNWDRLIYQPKSNVSEKLYRETQQLIQREKEGGTSELEQAQAYYETLDESEQGRYVLLARTNKFVEQNDNAILRLAVMKAWYDHKRQAQGMAGQPRP